MEEAEDYFPSRAVIYDDNIWCVPSVFKLIRYLVK